MSCLTLWCLMTTMGHNVYATGELQTQIQKPQFEGRWCQTRWCTGPMGTLRIGTKIDVTREITLDLGVLHSSYVNTNKDRGIESAYMSMTWRPFR